MKFKDLLKLKIGTGFLKKKVLLSTLPSPFLDNQNVFPYLGILYLLAVADKYGLRIKFFDQHENPINAGDVEKFDIFYTNELDLQNLAQYNFFDLIGLSCMTPQGEEAYTVCRALKNQLPKVLVMLGGPHAKYYLDECLDKGFDIIVVGEGERIFEALLFGNIGILEHKIISTESSNTLVLSDCLSAQEMNAFPVPLRQVEYLKKYQYLLDGILATTVVNSRGCPMRCAFCEDRKTTGKWFSLAHFELEIQNILELGYKGVMIFDDLFAISENKLKPYASILKKYHLSDGLIYRCFGHAKILSLQPLIAEILADSGCVEIGFGAESASQNILDSVFKGTTVQQLRNFVDIFIKLSIGVKAFFMIGLPGETEDMFLKTYDFLKFYRAKYPEMFDFDLSVFFPYKGTLIGDVVRLPPGKTINFESKEIDSSFFNLRPKDNLSWEEIDNGRYGAYKKRGGASDIVIETYDWKNGNVLLDANRIYELKEKAMVLSKRYSDGQGHRIFAPLVEGSLRSTTCDNMALQDNTRLKSNNYEGIK